MVTAQHIRDAHWLLEAGGGALDAETVLVCAAYEARLELAQQLAVRLAGKLEHAKETRCAACATRGAA